jgi:hypothetical protein
VTIDIRAHDTSNIARVQSCAIVCYRVISCDVYPVTHASIVLYYVPLFTHCSLPFCTTIQGKACFVNVLRAFGHVYNGHINGHINGQVHGGERMLQSAQASLAEAKRSLTVNSTVY